MRFWELDLSEKCVFSNFWPLGPPRGRIRVPPGPTWAEITPLRTPNQQGPGGGGRWVYFGTKNVILRTRLEWKVYIFRFVSTKATAQP